MAVESPMLERWNCDYLIKNGILDPTETTLFVAARAKHARLCSENLDRLVDEFVRKIEHGWLEEQHGRPSGLSLHTFNDVEMSLKEALDRWLFICSMSFSFWAPYVRGCPRFIIKDPWGRLWKGGRALAVRFNELLKCGVLLNATAFEIMPFSVFKLLFMNHNGAMPPMMEERWKSAAEVGSALTKNFGGSFYNCVVAAKGDPMKLLSLVLENFPCFRDHAVYEGRQISFLMKAQMLIDGTGRILREFNDSAAFESPEKFSLATTNRVVQMMHSYHLLDVTESVGIKVRKEELFEFGEPAEVEMRAVANRCIQLLTLRMNEKLKNIGRGARLTFMDVDYIIDRDRCEGPNSKGSGRVFFPKVRTVFY